MSSGPAGLGQDSCQRPREALVRRVAEVQVCDNVIPLPQRRQPLRT